MLRDGKSDTADAWKEQLGYVSGTVLGAAVLLLQLWPVLARAQIGLHSHALMMSGRTSEKIVAYAPLRIGIALGIGMILFGAVHVVGRGLWLTRFSLDAPVESSLSERISRRAYVVLYIYWVLAGVALAMMPIAILATHFEALLIERLGWRIIPAQLASSVVWMMPLPVAWVLIRRHGLEGIKRHFKRLRISNYVIAYVMLIALALVVGEFCYTVNVRNLQTVYFVGRDTHVVLYVDLGGATSAPEHATLSVLSSGDNSKRLTLRTLGGGAYLATLALPTLPAGEYRAELVYPHLFITPEFPFVRSNVKRSVGFSVVR